MNQITIDSGTINDISETFEEYARDLIGGGLGWGSGGGEISPSVRAQIDEIAGPESRDHTGSYPKHDLVYERYGDAVEKRVSEIVEEMRLKLREKLAEGLTI